MPSRMTFLPIVVRELRVTSRRARTYWSRTGVAAVMLLLASWVFVMSHRQAAPTQALALFGTLAGAMMFVGGLSGIGATADTLSSEKRDGTLGLLFLTPLRGYDVVLGKLCAGSLTAFYGLVSVTPLMALPLLMGGVSAGEFGRMALLIVNTMLLSLAVGICISSISRDEKRARGAALLVLILFAGGFPLAGAWLEHGLKLSGAAKWFLVFSPGYAFACVWERSRFLTPQGYWLSTFVLHLMTWLFLVLACWLAPRTWQDRPVKKWRLRNLLRPRTTGDDWGVAAFRRRLLARNAFYWLTSRPRFRPVLVWVALLLITSVWLGFGMKYPNDMFDPAMFVVMGLAWNGMLKAWVASEATRQIALERRSGSIELLLSTPLTVRDITDGLGLALRRQFGGPVLAVLVAEAFLLLVGLKDTGSGEDRVAWVAVWICGMSMLVADLVALYAVGLWQSAVAKGPAQASGGAAFRILALPWILYMLLGAAVAVADGLGLIRSGAPGPEWVFWLGSWTLIGFAVDLFFGVRAWRAFDSRFREVASHRGARRGWGYALGRVFGRIKAGPVASR